MHLPTALLALMVALSGGISSCGRSEPSALETEFTELIQSFVHAAARKDTTAINRLAVSGSALLRRLENWWAQEPDLLTATDGKLRANGAAMISPDTLYGEVTFRYRGQKEVFAAGFVRSESSWRLYYIGLPARL